MNQLAQTSVHADLSRSQMTTLPTRLLYGREDAAFQLSLSPRAVDYLIAKGAFGTIRRIGGRVLIPAAALIAFANRDHLKPIVPVNAT